MKALTFHGRGTIRYDTVPDPQLASQSDAIVKVDLTAICGSDLHVYHERERGLDRGTIMGHEFVGEIVELGREVKPFRKGDRVMSPFTTSCGQCFYCLCGLTCRCPDGQLFGWVQNGIGLQGVQAGYARIPLADSTLMRIPGGLLPEVALLLGDVLSTGFYCAELAEIRPGDVVAVIGCGPVGLMAIIGARESGAGQVYAIDVVAERLHRARSYGAIPINISHDNPVAILREATDGRGVDAVIELGGNAEAGRLAIEIVRPGGIVAAVAVHTEERFAFSPAEAYDKNLTYKTGRCPARSMMERVLAVAQGRQYDISSMITHRLPLRQGPEGYVMFDKKLDGCLKIILMPNDD